MTSFDPFHWFWIVAGDATRAWSSAARAWGEAAAADPERTSRIASAAELTGILRRYGLKGPVALADDVRDEASRRMRLLVNARDKAHLELLIANGTREAVRLLRKGSGNWTEDEAARAAELEQLDAAIEAIRAASNSMEADPPADYDDDARWPI